MKSVNWIVYGFALLVLVLATDWYVPDAALCILINTCFALLLAGIKVGLDRRTA